MIQIGLLSIFIFFIISIFVVLLIDAFRSNKNESMRSKPQNKMAKPRPKILDQQNQPQNDDKENNSVKTPQSRKIKGSTQATKTTTIETKIMSRIEKRG